MARLIDADALEFMDYETCDTDDCYPIVERVRGRNQIRKIVKDAPTVDAVPVVRCRECKHRYYYENDDIKPVCTKAMAYANTPDDWFCADGDRKGGDE